MASIADIDSGDWSWVDLGQYPGWTIGNGVLSYLGQEGYGPLPNSDALLDWPDGEGVEFHVTWPYDGPAFGLTYVNYNNDTQWVLDCFYSSVTWQVVNGSVFAGDEVMVPFRPAYFRAFREGNTFRLQCRASLGDAWLELYQSGEIPDTAWNSGWFGYAVAKGANDWHYIKGVTVGATQTALRVRLPDQTWTLAGVANNPIYVRVKEGSTEKWKAYAGGGGLDLAIRTPGSTWTTVSTAGGVYGIIRGVLKKGGVPLASRPVWIALASSPGVPLPGYQGATDAQGRFELSGFPLGQEYRFTVQISDLATGGTYFEATVDDPLAIFSFDFP